MPPDRASELPKTFDAPAVQREVAAAWTQHHSFHAEPQDPGNPYVILIPPPNVTAVLHVGHALNNTLQDILIRWRRMAGDNAVWLPGTDHAGIATQTAVEKKLLTEGKRRTDFSRESFVAHVQAWKDDYEKRITDQLKAMGCSCDWDRQAFTMDPIRTRAVHEAFFRLFRDKLIYRGKRLVNWDPITQTALADDEVEDIEIDGFFYYLRYPLVPVQGGPSDQFITVATTRPETMLGDTAVAVNPRDPRAAALRGRKVRLPIADRIIPIIEDDYVVLPDSNSSDAKARFATGFLKVTPAHDMNDWEIGQRHNLPVINVFAPDATISDKFGWPDLSPTVKPLLGLSREKAGEAVVEFFKQHNLLEEIRPYRHSVGHSYRSGAAIEPYLSDQWYCAMTDDRLRGAALRAMSQRTGQPLPCRSDEGPGDGKLTFHPSRYAKTFEAWHTNLRDWCISRQLWWGHRIPVWSRQLAPRESTNLPDDTASRAAPDQIATQYESGQLHVCLRDPASDGAKPIIAALEKAGFVRDPDVLDTWFSSGIWPLSTLGWPHQTPELAKWNPSSTLCTAREIITLWVGRMVMLNRYLHAKLPFFNVLIHPMIQDGQGRKMSKSLGNGVDPLDIIETHGCDAMRFTLATMATHTQDVRLPVEPDPKTGRNTSPKFDEGRGFINKLWNVARFVCSAIEKVPVAEPDESSWSFVDRWMLSRLAHTVTEATEALQQFRFDQYAKTCYDFIERDFSDWYVEASKPALRAAADSPQAAAQTANLLAVALDASLRLLHPIIPFVTERIWWSLNQIRPARGIPAIPCPSSTQLLIRAPFPAVAGLQKLHSADEQTFSDIQALITAVRNVRNTNKLDPRKSLTINVKTSRASVQQNKDLIESLAICQLAEIGPKIAEPPGAVRASAGPFEIYVVGADTPLTTDSATAAKRREELTKQIGTLRARLASPGYADKAPPKLVEQTRQQLAAAEAELNGSR
jgi:valyl-tRNA synthetase